MAKSGNNVNNSRAHSSKPYDPSNSFVKKVASRVSGLIPQSPSWISGWFSPSPSATQNTIRDPSPGNDDDFHDAFERPPPAKRSKPDTEHFSEDAVNWDSVTARERMDHRLAPSEFIDLSSVPGPSGYQPHKTAFVSSTPAITSVNHQDRKANGDDCSESGESTSGCSSLEPQTNRPNQSSVQSNPKFDGSPRKFLMEDRLGLNYFQNPRSLFLDHSVSSRNSHNSSRLNKPSFCMNTFGSPLSGGRNSLNELVFNSPFYAGRTTYGGASSSSSYRRSLGSTSISSSPANSDKFARHTIKVKPSNVQASVDSSMSQTARRILATLEQFSTPVLDAKRIPVSPQEPALSGCGRKRVRTEDASESRLLLEQSRLPQRSQRSLHWSGSAPNTSRLTVANLPDTLVLRRRERLQDSTTAARLIASSAPVTDMTCGLEAYKLRSEDDSKSNRQSFKMKKSLSRREKGTKDREFPLEVNLPQIALPIPSLHDLCIPPLKPVVAKPLPATSTAVSYSSSFLTVTSTSTISTSTATTSKPTFAPSSLIVNNFPKDSTFSFSTPIRVSASAKDQHLSPLSSYTFSSPLPAVDKQPVVVNNTNFLSTNLNSKELKRKSVCNEKNDFPNGLKPSSELKTGSVMDILGKEKIQNESKEINGTISLSEKLKSTAGSWECDKCMIRNKSESTRCVSCAYPREATTPIKSTSSSVTQTDGISTESFGAKFKMSSGMWECSACFVRNNDKDKKCLACGGSKPGDKPAPTPAPAQQTKTFGWGDTFKPPANTWECGMCMIRNDSKLDACQACSSKRPGDSPSPGATKPSINETVSNWGDKFKPPSNTWTCGECWVRNPVNTDTCTSCSTKRRSSTSASVSPAASTPAQISNWGDKFKKPQGSWDCGDCMITNKGADLQCVACKARKPGTEASVPPPNTNVQKFTFGMPPVSKATDTVPGVTNLINEKMTEKNLIPSAPGSEAKFGGFSLGVSTNVPGKFLFGMPKPDMPKEESSKPPTTEFSSGVPSSTITVPASSTNKESAGPVFGGKRKAMDDTPSSVASIPVNQPDLLPMVVTKPMANTVSSTVSSTTGPVYSFSASATVFGGSPVVTSTGSLHKSSAETINAISKSPATNKLLTASSSNDEPSPFKIGVAAPKDESVTSTWKPASSAEGHVKINADSTNSVAVTKSMFSFRGAVSSSGTAFGSNTTPATTPFNFALGADSVKSAVPSKPITFGSSSNLATAPFGAVTTESITPAHTFGSSAVSSFSSPTSAPAMSFGNSIGSSAFPAGSSRLMGATAFGNTTEEKKSLFTFGSNTTTTTTSTQTSTFQTQQQNIFTFATATPIANGPSNKSFTFGGLSTPSSFGSFNSQQPNPSAAFGFGASAPSFSAGNNPPEGNVGFGAVAPPSNSTPTFGGSPASSFNPPSFTPPTGGFNFTAVQSGFGAQATSQQAAPAASTPFGFGQAAAPHSFNPDVKPSFNFTGGNAVSFAASPADPSSNTNVANRRVIKRAARRAR